MNEQLKKIKIFFCHDEYYTEMASLFSKSFNYYGDFFDLQPIIIKSEKKNKFQDNGFRSFLIKKLEHIKQTIEDNKEDIIIWSDCDIICCNNPYSDIVKQIEKCDICGFIEKPKKNNRVVIHMNIGFIVIRCSDKTADLFSEVIDIARKNIGTKKYGLLDQDPFNECLKNGKHNVSISYFDERDYFLFHRARYTNDKSTDQLIKKKIIHFTTLNLDKLKYMSFFLKKIIFNRAKNKYKDIVV